MLGWERCQYTQIGNRLRQHRCRSRGRVLDTHRLTQHEHRSNEPEQEPLSRGRNSRDYHNDRKAQQWQAQAQVRNNLGMTVKQAVKAYLYEQQRLANIARNKDVLRGLGLGSPPVPAGTTHSPPLEWLIWP